MKRRERGGDGGRGERGLGLILVEGWGWRNERSILPLLVSRLFSPLLLLWYQIRRFPSPQRHDMAIHGVAWYDVA